ncbi:MAG: hypothetical protein IIW54_12025 [Lachnospiraceae bacterium]|nr:hypothetical protein [Lachnospiraceae bacterium]
MGYSITVKGKTYNMANKTIEIAKRIKGFSKLQRILEFESDNDAEKVEEIINDQYAFSCEALGQEAVDEILGGDLNEIDVDELLELSLVILDGYQSKALQKRREREEKALKDIVNNPNLNKALDVANKVSSFNK